MHTKPLVSTIIVTACIIFVLGETVTAAPIPTEVKSVVGFVYTPNNQGKLVPNGTGFFVGVQDPSTTDSFHVYFVTAKHVLCKPNTNEYFERIFVRLNKKGGGAEFGVIPLIPEGEKRTVFVNSDPSVDLAITPVALDQAKFDYKFLPADMITTKEAYIGS